MRLLFIADGRSPIAINWIRFFAESEHEVHLISTFPYETGLSLASSSSISVAFSGMARTSSTTSSQRALGGARRIGLRTALRHWLGPFTVLTSARRLREEVEGIKPDLIHAMRIPFEGMMTAAMDPSVPLIVSVWGNDFTLHAPASPWMRNLTRRTLLRADGLHVDCHRDQRLAHEWGFPEKRPIIVLPGAGGVKADVFHSASGTEGSQSEELASVVEGLPKNTPVIVNPRGFRAYVRNDTFFAAIPYILAERPETNFLCPAMAGEKRAETWIEKLEIRHAVSLLPKLSQEDMALVFRLAHVAVSPSEHDGTPNTLLEAMACGSFPIAGDLESIREWVDDGVNGLLIDTDQPEALAKAVLRVLDEPELRRRASIQNGGIIRERASYDKVMLEAQSFYNKMI
jgi:glycosyltransferase involved in cell wall biosynthesis